MSTRTASLSKLRCLTITGLFAALIFVFTAYLHIPTGSGYTHAGDGLIYLAACILPTPYAIAAAAIGGALADGLTGFPIWIPATVIVKAATASLFSNKSERIVTPRNILSIIPSCIVCTVVYSLYEGIFIAGGFSAAALTAAFAQTPSYIVQSAASGILFAAVGAVLDKANFKKKMKL